MRVEMVADGRCILGEGPLWHPVERRLYWVDIDRGRLYRYDPSSAGHELCYEGEPVGGLTVQADGSLLLFMARGAVAIWKAGSLDCVIREIPDARHTRFNDVVADPAGRVFCGTMPWQEGPGRLYRLDRDGTLDVVLETVGIPNGMGFTPGGDGMYFTDSAEDTISLFDYDETTGELGDRREFVRIINEAGVPDGLAVDSQGFVWSARWDGWAVCCYSPAGVEVLRPGLPAAKITSVAFGGEDLADLYVTTAGAGERRANGPGAGSLFRLRPGVKGRAEFPSRIGL